MKYKKSPPNFYCPISPHPILLQSTPEVNVVNTEKAPKNQRKNESM